jgi:uncharacterized protein YjcR
MIMNEDAVAIKPYSLTELAEIYGVSNHTMKNWIKRHQNSVGDKVGRLYTALQVKTIFEKLGLPDELEE